MVVGDDPLARAGLVSLLEERSDLEVISQLSPDDSLLATLEALLPDALIWDLGTNLDLAAWREGLGELKASGVVVVALLADSDQSVEILREILNGGASALLSREAGPERIAAAVDAVVNGLSALGPGFIGLIRSEGAAEPPLEELTDRERQVLGLVAEGLPNKTIAQRLDISEHTVKFHVNAILRKLGAQSRTEAVVRATRLGLIFL